MQDIECDNTKLSLEECNLSEYGGHHCVMAGHSNDATVECHGERRTIMVLLHYEYVIPLALKTLFFF